MKRKMERDKMKKADINYVFNQNLELAKIGTKERYNKYLGTIFPETKYQKIVWHHSNKKIEKFKSNFIEGYAAKNGVSPKAIFFLDSPAKKEFLSKRPYLGAFKLNLKNPRVVGNGIIPIDREKSGIKENISLALKHKNDGVIFRKIWDNRIWTNVYVVFSPSQVHTLASRKDVKEFKKYLIKQ